jgi:hypothetical protein
MFASALTRHLLLAHACYGGKETASVLAAEGRQGWKLISGASVSAAAALARVAEVWLLLRFVCALMAVGAGSTRCCWAHGCDLTLTNSDCTPPQKWPCRCCRFCTGAVTYYHRHKDDALTCIRGDAK